MFSENFLFQSAGVNFWFSSFFQCLYDKEQKGPITAITASSGYLIVAQGQKVSADIRPFESLETVYVHIIGVRIAGIPF